MPTMAVDTEIVRQVLATVERYIDRGDLRQRQRAPIDDLRLLLQRAEQQADQERRDGYETTVAVCQACDIRVSQCGECAGRLDIATEFIPAPPSAICRYCGADYGTSGQAELQAHYDHHHIGTPESRLSQGPVSPFPRRCTVLVQGERCSRGRGHIGVHRPARSTEVEFYDTLLASQWHCVECDFRFEDEYELRDHESAIHSIMDEEGVEFATSATWNTPPTIYHFLDLIDPPRMSDLNITA